MRPSKSLKAILSLSFITILLTAASVLAQQALPRIDPTGRSGDKRPDLFEEDLPPSPSPALRLSPPPLKRGLPLSSRY